MNLKYFKSIKQSLHQAIIRIESCFFQHFYTNLFYQGCWYTEKRDVARNSFLDLFNLSIQKPKAFTSFFYKMNFINSKKVKAIYELRAIQNILFELLKKSYLRAYKYMGIAAFYNFKLHIFLVVLLIQNHDFFPWKLVD